MTAGTDYNQLAEISGIGVTYTLDIDLSVGGAPRAYRVRAASGGSHDELLGEHLTWLEAMDRIRDEIANELRGAGIDPGDAR